MDYDLVSNKNTSTGLESFRVMTEGLRDDQIYFTISGDDKNQSEQRTDDSQGTSDPNQVSAVPPINNSISHISSESTDFANASLCDSISKENNLILRLNIDTPQLPDNSAVLSIPSNCNTPQLANIVEKSSTTLCKNCLYSALFWSAFSRIWTEYGEI